MKRFWIIFAVIFLFTSCTIEKFSELFSDGREIKSPEWDVDYELPILKKTLKMSDFVDVNGFLKNLQFRDEESIKETQSGLIYMSLEPIDISSEALNIDSNVKDLLDGKDPLTWPLPMQIYQSPEIIETSFPSIKMDINGDGVDDLSLDRLQSRDGYLKIGAKIIITDSNDETHDATEEEYFVDGLPVFAISGIDICDTTFYFDEATYDKEGKRLVFTPKGFLSDWNYPLKPVPKENSDEYIFKFKLPPDSLSVRGKGFDFIDNLIAQNTTEQEAKTRNTTSQYSRRSRAVFTPEDIKNMIKENNDGIAGLENIIKDNGLSVEDITNAYQKEDGSGINDLLEDAGEDVSITDILGSEVLTEDIEDFTELVKDYDLGNGTTLGDIADSGNLTGLSEFINFHKDHSIKGLKIIFSVEIFLGDTFIIVGKFIHDFTAISLTGTEAQLPLSNIGEIFKEIKINANINNTFSFPVDLKNVYLKGNQENNVPILFDGQEGNCRLEPATNKQYELNFSKPINELGDSGLLLDVIIPGGSECTVSLATDFMLDMNINVAGTANVDTNSLGL